MEKVDNWKNKTLPKDNEKIDFMSFFVLPTLRLYYSTKLHFNLGISEFKMIFEGWFFGAQKIFLKNSVQLLLTTA
jgi:hypothetical protein